MIEALLQLDGMISKMDDGNKKRQTSPFAEYSGLKSHR
jgi:hypothetical protein